MARAQPGTAARGDAWSRAASTATPTASPRRSATSPTARTCRSTARSSSACSRTRMPTSPARSPAPSTCSSPPAPTSRSARSCVPSTSSRPCSAAATGSCSLLDPFDGQQLHAAVAIGDVDTADHVSVFTPGFTSTRPGQPVAATTATCTTCADGAQRSPLRYGDGGTVATVTWLGYDAPQIERGHRLAPLGDHAQPGAHRRGRPGGVLRGHQLLPHRRPAPDRARPLLRIAHDRLRAPARGHRASTTPCCSARPAPARGTATTCTCPTATCSWPRRTTTPSRTSAARLPSARDPSHMEWRRLPLHPRARPARRHARGAAPAGTRSTSRRTRTSQYNLAVTVAGLDRTGRPPRARPPLFRDGRPDRGLLQLGPGHGPRGRTRPGAGVVETGAGAGRGGTGGGLGHGQGLPSARPGDQGAVVRRDRHGAAIVGLAFWCS